MFDPMLENLRKASEMTIQMQQEMFKKWAGLWPNPVVAPSGFYDQAQKAQKKWAEVVEETLKKQREAMETQFNAGMKNLELAFSLGEVKDMEQLRTKTMELWQKTFESLRQTFEAQVRNYQSAMSKWHELMTRDAA